MFRPRIETESDRVQWKGGSPFDRHRRDLRDLTASRPWATRRAARKVSSAAGNPADEEPCARTISLRSRVAPIAGPSRARTFGRCSASTRRPRARAASKRDPVGADANPGRARVSVPHRAEPKGVAAGHAYRIADLELASRLSFFLWSSIPDDELLAVAERGNSRDPADPRTAGAADACRSARRQAFGRKFRGAMAAAAQSRARRAGSRAVPDFDENLRDAFRQETELFLESKLREDRASSELVDADYTFLNERLARHYRRSDMYGSHFRRVTSARFDAATRAPRSRQPADGDVVCQPDLGGAARPLGAGELL